MSTKNKWFVGIGITIGLIILFFLPFVWQTLFHAQGIGGMMGYGNNPYSHSPMLRGNGFSPAFGMMGVSAFFIWLIPLGLLVLSGLGIAALVKYLRSQHN